MKGNNFFFLFFYFKCFVSLLCTTKPFLMAYSMEYGVLSMVLFLFFFSPYLYVFLTWFTLDRRPPPSAFCHLIYGETLSTCMGGLLFRVSPFWGMSLIVSLRVTLPYRGTPWTKFGQEFKKKNILVLCTD